MTDSEYARLSLSDEGWCCNRCFKEAFPFFDSSSTSISADATPDDNVSPHNPPLPSNIDGSSQHLLSRPHSSPQLRILYTNSRSLTHNLDSLRAYTASINPDIIALCKTWLDKSITDLEIFLPCYYIVRRDRNRRGGSVMLYVRDTIPTSASQVHPTLELLTAELPLSKYPSIGPVLSPSFC